LLFFSEAWYGPDKGWKAYIDKEEVPILRANYMLRGLKVPAGSHEIVFEFKPQKYYFGNQVSGGDFHYDLTIPSRLCGLFCLATD
jgi:uncharacterized membrane protein YfhO